MGVFFRADTTRMSFGELWRLSSSFRVFLTACVNKIFQIRTPARWAVRHEDAIRVLQADKISLDAMRRLEPLINGFQQLGARLAFYHSTETTKNLQSCAAVLLPVEQNAVISCVWTRSRIATPGKETAVCGLTSRLQDGTFLSTTNWSSPFNKPPGFKTLRIRRATPAQLSRLHEEALAGSGSWPIPVRNKEDAIKILVEAKRRTFEWKLSRGVYVPLTREELTELGLSSEEQS